MFFCTKIELHSTSEMELALKVKVFNHRQPLLMFLLCMIKKGFGYLPHELGLLLASFLPDIGEDEKKYKQLYKAFLEEGYILGPLIRLSTLGATYALIGTPTVNGAGKITKVKVIQYYSDAWNRLTFSFDPKMMRFDTLKKREEEFENPFKTTHEEWMQGYKTYEMQLRAFREANLIEFDKKNRDLERLQATQQQMIAIEASGRRWGTKKSRAKLLFTIFCLKNELSLLVVKRKKMSLYL